MFARKPIALLVLLIMTVPLSANASLSAIPGAFVDVGIDARAMGMGGANSAGSGKVADLVWNPAGLARLGSTEITAMQTEQFGLVPTYFLGVGLPTLWRAPISFGIISSGDALMRENTLLVGTGLNPVFMRGIEVGATIKLRHASFGSGGTEDCVDGSALGLAFDIGLSGQTGPVRLGLVLEEALSDMKWDSSAKGSYHESVPHTLTGGLQFNSGPFCYAMDIEFGIQEERVSKGSAGLEWTPHPILQLRGGLKQNLDADAERFATIGVGVGHTLHDGRRLQLDTAYLLHDLGNSLRISFGYLLP
ncbi:MAG: hypothetical protein GY835_21405 [bacterium]|nr:hypothetical protein [bacterium]